MTDPNAVKLLSTLRDMITKEMKMRSAYTLWIKHWPNYCQFCDAAGLVDSTENAAPHGEGYWPMHITEQCSNCCQNGFCPRCNFLLPEEIFEKELPCPNCKWNWGEKDDDLCPVNGFEGETWDHAFDQIAQYIRGEE